MDFNNMAGTDRYNAEKFGNTDFELIAESSMKPFANNSHSKPSSFEALERTDINTTPSSADKLQQSVRKSNISMISNGPNFNNGGFGINQQSTNFQQTSNVNPLAVHVI